MYQFLINDPAHGLQVHTNQVLLLLAVVVCCWHGAHALRRIDGLDWHRAVSYTHLTLPTNREV